MTAVPKLVKDIRHLFEQAVASVNKATTLQQLEQVRIAATGRKSRLTQLMRDLSRLPPDQRPEAGKVANEVKQKLAEAFEQRRAALEAEGRSLRVVGDEAFDITLPGRGRPLGRLHPLSQTLQEIEGIFVSMGFAVALGPEIENDFNNFAALNFPDEHPARDMQDTFYLSGGWLLRTHTSPVQIRTMLSTPPPLAIIAPGRVFRADADVTHSPQFHQVEGLLMDRRITLGDLKGVLQTFAHSMFGPQYRVRFRPSFFPFTEPSAEVDIGCVICGGRGCRVCKGSGWLEILGAGMVHPAVLENVGYDSERWSGFAFGMGVERIAMLKYGMGDIRLFFENDVRFLRQF
ncbi:phenylalanine--tRNA ligase subunit alpha [Candidatus Sumerlaeota bacterium]|nr:phenylalanine--tRNA ligase subunit alpha [Candidatus Sumerlaeota bacterium]